MRFPLLIGARPRFVKQGPTVPLGEGKWFITADHRDSRIAVCHAFSSKPFALLNGKPLEMLGPVKIFIMILAIGTEDEINAYAELAHDLSSG
jgi:hypothetical protein